MENNPPAFPITGWSGSLSDNCGMSLREYYVGQALASGLCPHNAYEHEAIAMWCWEQARAMLAVRGLYTLKGGGE